MSAHRPRTVLVLGGIRSGKSEYAESLLPANGPVRYIATAETSDVDDPDWSARVEAHRRRRPDHWTTEEIGKDPDALASLILAAAETDTLLVDDIGGWVTAQLHAEPDADATDAAVLAAPILALSAAVGAARARVVLVSPEVGLSVIPPTRLGRDFADAVGAANRALAAACQAVVLVVAGQPVWLRPPGEEEPAAAVSDEPSRVVTPERPPAPPVTQPAEAPGEASDEPDIETGMTLPLPDGEAANRATARVERLPVAGAGLGPMVAAVAFAASTRGTDAPAPFASVRVIAIGGTHGGGIATGDSDEAWAARRDDTGSVLHRLALSNVDANATIEYLSAGRAAPIEDGDAMTEAGLAAALRRGFRAAEAAADRGNDLIVLAAGGPGMDAAATAVVAGITRLEVAALLPRVFVGDGTIDDNAWMTRCLTLRDALRRVRDRVPDGPTSLAALGGPSLAVAAGLLLGAAQRRTPVLIDGPVGAAAALAARDYAAQTRLWCQLTDVGGDPTVRAAADRVGLAPLFDVGFALGEGANALALLPTIQAALVAAAAA
jgi:adenosyl cobinamide kinase/adenosyl cobinamide phosphate guanylyltransferase